MNATFLNKMTIKDMGCDAKVARDSKYKPGAVGPDGQALPTAGAPVPLCIIYGRIGDVKYVDSKFTGDPQASFIGSFEGVNLQAVAFNETAAPGVAHQITHYQSGKLYVPGGFANMLEGSFKSLDANSGDMGIEFAVKIFSAYDESAAVGYTFKIQNLKEITATDDLAGLRGMIQSKVPVPLGPVAAPAPAALPAAETPATAPAADTGKTKKK